jgi:hypothetical protein
MYLQAKWKMLLSIIMFCELSIYPQFPLQFLIAELVTLIQLVGALYFPTFYILSPA